MSVGNIVAGPRMRVLGAAVLLSMCPDIAVAQDSSETLPWKTVELQLGTFLAEDETKLRISTKGGLGTEFDVGDTLGFDKDVSSFWFDGGWRFLPRHRLSFGVYQFSRGATRDLTRTIEVGDSAFQIGTIVSSSTEITVYKAAYTYSVVHNAAVDFGLTAGAHILDYRASINAFNQNVSENERVLAPLPVLGLRGAWAITPNLFLKGSFNVFAISADETSGKLRDGSLAVEYDFLKNFGIGVGYNRVLMDLNTEGNRFDTKIDQNYGGVIIYGNILF